MFRLNSFILEFVFFAVLLLLVLPRSVYSAKEVQCKYIGDIIRGKEDTEGVLDSPTNTEYCLDGEGENAYHSTELALSNSTIGILKKNAVRNMPWLVAIYCIYCKIDLIEPGAFENVSNIVEFEFSFGVIPEIRRGIFDVLKNLEVLDIRGNKIYNIDDGALANMPKLRHLNLNGNLMEYWKREWFTNSTSIVTVKFVKNKLRSIPSSAFADFSIIQNVHFDDNEITTIHKDAFKGVKLLFTLGLANNRLKTLSESMFPNNIKIEIFDISGNELNYIPSKVMKKLKTDKTFLGGNPWKCQCLNLINFWLELTDGKSNSNSDDPECNGPNIPLCVASVSSSCLESVDTQITQRYFSHPEVVKRKANRLCTKSYYELFYGEQL